MRLPTYTSTFKVRRKLYAIYDWELPWPLEVPQIVAFLGGLVLMMLVLRLAQLHLGPSTAVFVIGVPVALAWLAPRAVADRKAAHVWLATQLVHLAEPMVLHDLRCGAGTTQRLEVVVACWEHGGRPALAVSPQARVAGTKTSH
jgi:hypothetical protein